MLALNNDFPQLSEKKLTDVIQTQWFIWGCSRVPVLSRRGKCDEVNSIQVKVGDDEKDCVRYLGVEIDRDGSLEFKTCLVKIGLWSWQV